MSDQSLIDSASDQSLGHSAVVGTGLILAAVILFVWKSSLDGSFQFDDYGNILNKENLIQPSLIDYLTNNRPFGLYTLAINKQISGDSTYGFHVFNLLVHVVNATLIYCGILLSRHAWQRVRGTPTQQTFFWLTTAALVAMLWAIHPLTTQAVTYIVQRYESLSAMGYLGAWVGLLVVLACAQSKFRMIGYGMILVFAWIGLMSKEVFATAPLSILLFDRYLTRQSFREIFSHRWLAYGLMFSPFTWFIPSVSRWFDTSQSSSMGLGMQSINSWEYLRTQPEVILYYLKLSFWPHPQSIDYVWRIQQNPLIYLSLGLGILAMLAVGLWWYTASLKPHHQSNRVNSHTHDESNTSPTKGDFSRFRGWVGWGILSFFFILAPTSSIMPIADLAVEHRMYLPLSFVVAFVVYLVAFGFLALWKQSTHRIVLATGMSLIVVGIGGSLAWRTHVRNLDYRDELTIWTKVTEVSPENPRGWYHVGSLLFKQGHRDAALPYMISAVGYGGSQIPMYDVGLGDCLRHAGRVKEALFFYRRAIENQPGFAEAHNNLGVVYLDREDIEMADHHFTIASGLDHPEAMHNLAMIHEQRGEFQSAVLWLTRALEIATEDGNSPLANRIERKRNQIKGRVDAEDKRKDSP